MHILLYLTGGFMVVLGIGSLIVSDPITGLIFIGILVLAVAVATALVRADDQAPPIDENPMNADNGANAPDESQPPG